MIYKCIIFVVFDLKSMTFWCRKLVFARNRAQGSNNSLINCYPKACFFEESPRIILFLISEASIRQKSGIFVA